MSRQEDYILWLPSWYPNRYEPFNGDFIQRHAQAAAVYTPITVIHFVAPGEATKVATSEVTTTEYGGLKELIVYHAFHPCGITPVDKIAYNFTFYKAAKKFIMAYFAAHGLPKLVHVHVPVKAGNIALFIKWKFGIRYIVSEQSSYYMPEAPNSYYKRHLLYKRQTSAIFQKALLVTNVSATIGLILKKTFHLNNVVTVPNTVNTRFFYYANVKPSVFTFIHVSTLTEQKNIMGILKTFARLVPLRSDWKLKIVGPASKLIHSFVQANGLSRHVELIGEIRYADVAHQMQNSHALVLFSRHENFPCVVVEALCCGLPVVSAAVAGIGEAIDHSNGILVPSENEVALQVALVEIMDNFYAYDCRAISEKASSLYKYETIGRQFFNLYYPYAGNAR